jgi:transcriptional regulator with XRE-family HTH domain
MPKREITRLDERIAKNVIAERRSRDWTQEQLAEKMGCTPGMVTLLETCKRSWTTKWVVAAADAFGLHETQLMGGAPISETDYKILQLMKKNAETLREIEGEGKT